MAKYIHIPTGTEVEATQFPECTRWQIPGAAGTNVGTQTNTRWMYPHEEVDTGEWEVVWAGKKFLYPRLVFPMLFAPVSAPPDVEPQPPEAQKAIAFPTLSEGIFNDYGYPGTI